MIFEKIIKSILSSENQYEKPRGIETLSIKIIAGGKDLDWAVYEGKKSDTSSTLFWAHKHKRSDDHSWWWMCPSKNHIGGLKRLIEMYKEIDYRNKFSPRGVKEVRARIKGN